MPSQPTPDARELSRGLVIHIQPAAGGFVAHVWREGELVGSVHERTAARTTTAVAEILYALLGDYAIEELTDHVQAELRRFLRRSVDVLALVALGLGAACFGESEPVAGESSSTSSPEESSTSSTSSSAEGATSTSSPATSTSSAEETTSTSSPATSTSSAEESSTSSPASTGAACSEPYGPCELAGDCCEGACMSNNVGGTVRWCGSSCVEAGDCPPAPGGTAPVTCTAEACGLSCAGGERCPAELVCNGAACGT